MTDESNSTQSSPDVGVKPTAAPKAVQGYSRLWQWLLGIVVVLVIVAVGIIYGTWRYYNAWIDRPLTLSEGGYEFVLKPGQTLVSVGRELSAKGILEHPILLRFYARSEKANKIHAGDYRLNAGETPRSLVKKLVDGDVIVNQVTFIEGWTVKQILSALANQPNLKHTLGDASIADIQALLKTKNSLEGWIYPDTYTFHRGTKDIDILRQAHKRMQSTLSSEWKARSANLPYKTPYEALIMASIVERETGHAAERADVAGVFVRRLQQGMKLQTDPTVIYGMGDAYKGRITRKDLETPTPFNTYVIEGLPPTPISNPSAAAIRAALNPATADTLYFVAKGDGTSHFSKTLQEHNEAVRRYQLNRRRDYRAAPPPTSAASQSSISSSVNKP